MYQGFLSASGVEIVNGERTETYVEAVGNGLALNGTFNTDKVHLAVEDAPYRSPLIDDAPWVNPLEPSSTDFFGLYPLEIEGLDTSTLGAQSIQHLDDGASFGLQRDTSRPVRVHGILVGGTHAGAEYGLSWLGDAVRQSNCGQPGSCTAGDLVYFTSEPDVCEYAFGPEHDTPDSQLFGTISGPQLLSFPWPGNRVLPAMPSRASWDLQSSEGTRFTYGAMPPDSIEPLYESAVIAPFRRNYVLNPSLLTGTNNWQGIGADLSWNPGPGYVGDGYGHVAPNGTIPNPEDSNAFGEDGFGDGAFGGYSDWTAYVRVLGFCDSMVAGPGIASIALRGADISVVVSVRDVLGATVGHQTFAGSEDWTRVSVPFDLVNDGPVRIVIDAASAFDFDAALVEVGEYDLPYFDGDTPPSKYAVTAWEGDDGDSTSILTSGEPLEVVRDDSSYRPFFRLLGGTAGSLTLYWYMRDRISMPDQLIPYERTLHDVTCTQGPQVIKRYRTDVGYFIEIDLIFEAGNPHPFSNPVAVDTTPLSNAPYTDPDDVPDLDDTWLRDPDSIAVTSPVRAPAIIDTSVQTFTTWQRYYVSVPASLIRQWGYSAPTIGINSKASSVKQVRVRFHPNPFNYAPEDVDPLNYCSEFIVSYLPSTTRLLIDGVTRRAVASRGGYATVPADHLLFGGTNGAPITWPELTCGISYVMTLDVPTSDAAALIDVDLSIRARG